jgi:hypothetical protein
MEEESRSAIFTNRLSIYPACCVIKTELAG